MKNKKDNKKDKDNNKKKSNSVLFKELEVNKYVFIIALGFLLIVVGIETNLLKYEGKPDELKDNTTKKQEIVTLTADNFKFGFDYDYDYQLLTPGTYTIENLDDLVVSHYIGSLNTKVLNECDSNSLVKESKYIDEKDMKTLFEKTFGEGTYRVFTYKTPGGCGDMYYRSGLERYESECLDVCGESYEYEFETSILSEKKYGDKSIVIERVDQRAFGSMDIINSYELTYTYRNTDNFFISVVSKKL